MFINSRLRTAFKQFAPDKNDPSRDPKIYIPATQELIDIARSQGHRGDRHLKRLVQWHKDEFAPESRMAIYDWLKARGTPIKAPKKKFYEVISFLD